MSVIRVIHYGSNELGRINPIKNRQFFNKPSGGLWTSPVDCEYGWKAWCEGNHFRKCEMENAMILDIINPRVFKIETQEVEEKYWVKEELMPRHLLSKMFKCLNYEMLAQEYDVIHLTMGALGLYSPFYGWDCETVLVINPDVEIKQIKNVRHGQKE